MVRLRARKYAGIGLTSAMIFILAIPLIGIAVLIHVLVTLEDDDYEFGGEDE